MQLIKKIRILVIGLIILTASCTTTELAHKKYPIIPKPNRPLVSSKLTKDDFKKITKYAEKLEIGINEYNIYAEEQNKKLEEYLNK